MKTALVVVFLSFLFGLSHGKELPSFINKCKLSDPAINECMKNRVQEFTKYLPEGVKELRLLSVKNYVVPEMTLKLPWANVTLKDAKFEPLYDYVVDTFNMDLDKGELKIKLSHKYISLKADYVLDGKLIQLNIHGEGKAEAKTVDIVGDATITGKKKSKNGQEYFEVETATYKFTKHKLDNVYLSNLFGDNVELTKRINDLISENREELFADAYPALEIIMSSLILNLFKAPFNTFSLGELFD
ncbi:hypothetical protein Trydic_g494 [Trypoxylus dichotomus]